MKCKLSFFLIVLSLSSCSEDFLDIELNGRNTDLLLANEENIDKLLVGAYSMLDGMSEDMYTSYYVSGSNWFLGDVRGLIANKGSDVGDCCDGSPLAVFKESAKSSVIYEKWRAIYEAVARCNNTLRVINLALQRGSINQDEADLFKRQARALRGWYFFDAWRLWEKIPYVDEKTDIGKVTNTQDIRSEIIEDLREGSLLPDNLKQIGRFNGTVSKVLLAKALMQMYHNYQEALPLLQDVISNGTKPDGSPIGLSAKYGDIFDIENRNNLEAIYTIQYSVNDGSGGWNGGYGDVLNFPYKPNGESPAGCCGFFQPNMDYVNSFRTKNGLPLLDNSYNDDPVKSDMGIRAQEPFVEDTGPLDPRIDWSVGRRGIPYWDWGIHTGSDWIRDQNWGGPYSPKKQVYKKSQEELYTERGSWTSGFTANGYRMIRYADVLLLTAECQIETGDLQGALENINAVRARAANPEGFVLEEDGITPAANYQISLYTDFPDADYARSALRMERKLELGMEGHRWFDLKRWGIAVEDLNRIITYENTLRWLYSNTVVVEKNLIYPIPEHEIKLSNGRLIQN